MMIPLLLSLSMSQDGVLVPATTIDVVIKFSENSMDSTYFTQGTGYPHAYAFGINWYTCRTSIHCCQLLHCGCCTHLVYCCLPLPLPLTLPAQCDHPHPHHHQRLPSTTASKTSATTCRNARVPTPSLRTITWSTTSTTRSARIPGTRSLSSTAGSRERCQSTSLHHSR